MDVLVDTSVWIDYFRGGKNSKEIDSLIDENLIAINELILAELIPVLKLKKQANVIRLLNEVNRIPMDIDWKEITEFQFRCLKNGVNGVGIPDFIIAQNSRQNNARIYTLDKHFKWISRVVKLRLYQ